MNMSHLCRSCMKEVLLWEIENFDNRFMNMFSYCTNIQVTDQDVLPKQLCYDCSMKVEAMYCYVQEAHRVNQMLLNMVQPSVIVEPHSVPRLDYDEPIQETFDTNETEPLDPHHEVNAANTTSVIKLTNDVIKETTPTVNVAETCEVQKHVCLVCQKKFLSKVWFEKHMKNQHGGKLYSCTQCSKTFKKPSLLSLHSVAHSNEKKFACQCGRRYKRRKELTIHARTHREERPYQCDHCNQSFKLKSVLKSHLVLHEPSKPFLCYICGWGFAQAGNLSVHMRTHSGDKPHGCARCGFRAATASGVQPLPGNLSVHMRTHSGDKPHGCARCGFRAATASSVKRHERAHRAARPHQCRSCGKAFRDKAGLTRHERSHTGARPYRCPGCPRAFSDSWKRKTHLMRAHRVPLSRIPRMRADPQHVLVNYEEYT